MKIWTDKCALYIKREPTDRQFYGDESRLLYHIKDELNNKHGLDLVKRRCEDDGQLTGCEHYLRDRGGRFAIWDAAYQVWNLAEHFDISSKYPHGYIELTVECEDPSNPPFSIEREAQNG